ncbi:hypothetical protein [Sphingobium sp. YG1]|uniref:hypothetical protein n=1 Tax=Sphingobium sp. YG1 TaxID=2082188 RepID=UPI000DBB907A|nr:hypothetical protein [Sphingobium sp. YG1]BBC99115.1 hypothetical protein YGS_C1P0371 [Sphingobium sp. YG1]
MDKDKERRQMEFRLSALEFLVARMAAELFEDAASMTAWTNAMDAEREKATANWQAKRPVDSAEKERMQRIVMAEHAQAWDDLLSSVRAHFGKLHGEG